MAHVAQSTSFWLLPQLGLQALRVLPLVSLRQAGVAAASLVQPRASLGFALGQQLFGFVHRNGAVVVVRGPERDRARLAQDSHVVELALAGREAYLHIVVDVVRVVLLLLLLPCLSGRGCGISFLPVVDII